MKSEAAVAILASDSLAQVAVSCQHARSLPCITFTLSFSSFGVIFNSKSKRNGFRSRTSCSAMRSSNSARGEATPKIDCAQSATAHRRAGSSHPDTLMVVCASQQDTRTTRMIGTECALVFVCRARRTDNIQSQERNYFA